MRACKEEVLSSEVWKTFHNLGRKNFMFCGNDDAAERTATIYSLLGSCKLAGVNPMEWLTDVLERIQDHPASKLSELLPSNWKPLK